MSNSLRPHGHQAPPSMGFSRQECWSVLPFPSPGNFPTQGSNPGLPHCRQMLYHLSQQGSPQFNSWVRKMLWRRDRLPTPVFLGFPGGSDDKEPASNVGDLGLIPSLGRSSGEERGNSLQYSCLENPHGQRSLAGHKELDMTE